MLPSEYRSAMISLMFHLDTPKISAGMLSSSIISLTRDRYSAREGSKSSSEPGNGNMMNIHLQ